MVRFIGTRTCLTWQDYAISKEHQNQAQVTIAPANRPIVRLNRAVGAVLKMLTSGQTPAYVANALAISENSIYRWKSVNQVGKKSKVLAGDLVVENQQLKDRLR